MGKGSGSCDERPSMPVFALSDPHLGPAGGKQHYSSGWHDHQSKMRKAWDKKVPDNALVLMPGDFSWHKDPEDLRYDYLWMDERPGELKVLSPGNHDYGVWNTQKEVREFLEQFKTLEGVVDDAMRLENPHSPDAPGVVIASVQGSQSPGDEFFNTNAGFSAKGKDAESVRFLGELVALDEALRQGRRKLHDGDDLVVMIHYPPFANGHEETVYSKMIERAGAKLCLYGHLHQKEQFRHTFQGERNGVEYRFVGADFLKFEPTQVGEMTPQGLEVGDLEVDAKKAWPEDKKKDDKKDKKDKKSDQDKSEQRISGWGKPLHCAECNGPIYKNEKYHYTTPGAVHGDGDYNQLNTCWFAKGKTDKAKGGKADSSTSNGSTVSSAARGSSKKYRLTRSITDRDADCQDCGGPVNVGEIYHPVDGGIVHGAGVPGQRNTCFHRNKNSSAPPAKAKAKAGSSKKGNGKKSAAAKSTAEPKLCIQCGGACDRHTEWHISTEGPVHGKGSVDAVKTCRRKPVASG